MSTMEEAVEKLKAQAEPIEQPEIEEIETPDEPNLEVEVETPEPETEVSESETPEAETGAEAIELEADQFAELLGLKSDLLDVTDEGIRFKAKVDNDTVDVTLEQLINAYQGDANLTNRSKELAEMKKAREAELQNMQLQTQQFAQQSAALLEGLQKQFLEPFEDINWKQLKEDDPGEYAAQMADKRAIEERIGQIANQAVSQINEAQQIQNQELQEQYRDYLGQQEKMLTDATSPLHVPSFEKVYPEIREYMGSLGYSEQEVNQVADARIINALHKAMLFDKGKKGIEKKLSKPLPKVLKPGKSPSKQEASLDATRKLHQKLKESGRPEDAVALLRAKLR